MLKFLITEVVPPVGAVLIQGDGHKILSRFIDPSAATDLGGYRFLARDCIIRIDDIACEHSKIRCELVDDIEYYVAALNEVVIDVGDGEIRITSPALPTQVRDPDKLDRWSLVFVRR